MRATRPHAARNILAALAALSLLGACGDDDASGTDTATTDTVESDTATETDTSVADTAEADTSVADTAEADTSVADTAEADTTEADTAAADTVEADTLPSVDDNCAEASLEECFSNHDCEGDERCQDISTSAFEIPCCVTAPRGSAAAGETCVDAEDCASGLCVSRNDGPYLCTDTCTDVGDCPANMQECDTFFVAPGTWCLHTP